MKPNPNKVWCVFGTLRGLGGTERRFLEMLEFGFLREEVEFLFFSHRAHPDYVDKFRSAGARVRVLRTGLDLVISLAKEKEGLTLVILGFRPFLLTSLAKVFRLHHCNIVTLQNGQSVTSRTFRRWLQGKFENQVEAIISNSKSVSADLRNSLKHPEKVRLVESGLGPGWENPSPRILKGPILMVGNFRKEKNFEIALDAYAASGLDRQLHIYTDKTSGFRDLIRTLSSSARQQITVIEGEEVLPSTYDRYSILFHPAKSEGRPRVAMEAASRGLVLVSSAVGDLGDIARDARGVLVNPFDSSSLVVGLIRADSLVKRGARFHSVKFKDFSTYCNEFLKVIQECQTQSIVVPRKQRW